MLEEEWQDLMMFSSKMASFSILIPVVFGIKYKKYWNWPLYILFLYCILTFLFNWIELLFIWATGEYTSFFMPYLNDWKIYNTVFLQIFFVLKNLILLSIFYCSIFYIKKIKKLILFTGGFLSIIVTGNYFFYEGFRDFGVITPSINGIYIVLLPLFYLWFSQRDSIRISLKKSPYFWISLGLFIPNFIGLFFYFSGNFIQQNNFTLFSQTRIVKNLFEILGYILIAVGFSYSYYARFIRRGTA